MGDTSSVVSSGPPRLRATKAMRVRMAGSLSVRMRRVDSSPASRNHATTSSATPTSLAPLRRTALAKA
eukprot:11526590-Heterocapsa_arctica.AAC.1